MCRFKACYVKYFPLKERSRLCSIMFFCVLIVSCSAAMATEVGNADKENDSGFASFCSVIGASMETCIVVAEEDFKSKNASKKEVLEAKWRLIEKGRDEGWLNKKGNVIYEMNKPRSWKKWQLPSAAVAGSALEKCVDKDKGDRYREVLIAYECKAYRIDNASCDENFKRNPEFFSERCFGSAEAKEAKKEIGNWARKNGYEYMPPSVDW